MYTVQPVILFVVAYLFGGIVSFVLLTSHILSDSVKKSLFLDHLKNVIGQEHSRETCWALLTVVWVFFWFPLLMGLDA